MKINPIGEFSQRCFKILIYLIGLENSLKTFVFDPKIWVIFIGKYHVQILLEISLKHLKTYFCDKNHVPQFLPSDRSTYELLDRSKT